MCVFLCLQSHSCQNEMMTSCAVYLCTFVFRIYIVSEYVFGCMSVNKKFCGSQNQHCVFSAHYDCTCNDFWWNYSHLYW